MDGLAGLGDESVDPRRVRVVGSELVDNYTVYVIEVYIGMYHWMVKHRYSDFYDLHEKLTSENNVAKNLLPPKKMIGKNSKSLVERRQIDLEVYLQTLLAQFPAAVPRSLSYFLHFHLYEISGISAVLAEELFHKGEKLLLAGEVFVMKPLQLYAITQLLRHAQPTWLNGDAKSDLGHILDFTCRLKYLKITGTRGPFGTSNIQEDLLPYDLSIFKSLCQIEVSHCNARNITGLNYCKNTLATMTVQFSTESMKDILVPEALEFDQWEPEGTSSDPITAVVSKWKALTTLDMSHNHLPFIDDSVKLIPQIEYLDLSHNIISSVGNLQHLFNLIHLDLSYNNISDLDGIHTKVGNIKTLNLAGNQLESLSGLSKLYSLVNLDLSYNKVAQLEEIRHVGHLPCLENINMSLNPLVIIPDYRTKVLAQFGERAAEVCLDNTKTTEKELDTVEVLKAIQKAKETRNTFYHSNKKMSEDSQLTESNSDGAFPANVSSHSLSLPVSCSQDLVTDTMHVCSHSTYRSHHILSQKSREGGPQDSGGHREPNTSQCDERVCLLREDKMPVPELDTPLYIPYRSQQQELFTYLSASIAQALGQSSPAATEDKEGHSRSLGPENGYFEMGRHKENDGNHSRFPLENTQHGVCILRVHWTFSVQLQRGHSRKQFASCLVLTDSLVVFFEVPSRGAEPDHLANFSLLRLAFYYSYRDLAGFGFLLPEICLTMKLRNGDHIFVLANAQSLQDLFGSLCTRCPESDRSLECSSRHGRQSLEEFLQRLGAEQHMALEDREVKGCFPVCLFYGEQQEDVFISADQEQSGTDFLPMWAFLTQNNLILLKTDFDLLSGECNPRDTLGNAFYMKKVPLSSVLLHPAYKSLQELDGHVLQLLVGTRDVSAFFALPDDKLHFLTLYKVLRTSLQCVKDIGFSRSLGSEAVCEKMQLQSARGCCLRELSASYPPQCLVQKLSEENQIAFHLPVSSSLNVISKMNGKDILQLFHGSISEADGEELRFLMWSSVIFYKEPDSEATACVLLSTEAVYFLFVDSELDSWNQHQTFGSCHLSRCLVVKFSDLHSVNVGLFDQYFRITGPSASHVITCVTRDSYTTHAFIQHLMSALSLMARTPSPEPLEKDFYSEFGNKNSGKMDNYELIHSSRVKFIYPSEEEIGDLTFVVKENIETCAKLQSLNILLYVLAFQVLLADGATHNALLQPKTLILTSSDLFLLNEDYISYPLPDFAKEPPKRDKYQLVDGRRIRDLDRVLLGYQTYPQTLTFVFDDVPIQDLTCTLSMDHFGEAYASSVTQNKCGRNREVHLDIFVPSAECREKLISLLARQWEILCGRELPLELTG